MRESDWTKVLGWPGFRVYQHEINESAKTLKLRVRRKRGNRKLVSSGCGRKFADAYDSHEREVRDLPYFEYRTTVVVELYRVRCPDFGIKASGGASCLFSRDRNSKISARIHGRARLPSAPQSRTNRFLLRLGRRSSPTRGSS